MIKKTTNVFEDLVE